MTYLRSRFYASGTGRFLTRDTWGGNNNSPISYNKWVYAYQNPINLLDPTGMKPGDSKYCFPLSGRDSQYCNNIVRGINPDQPMTAGDYIVFDQLDSCYTPPLHEVLPHSAPTYTQFGLWYHYLLERTPGWWNNQGRDHIYFRDVIAFALGVELSSKGSDRNLVGYAAGAFATKAWASGQGFYKFIGSRQSVFMRVNHALYGTNSGLDENGNGLPYNFAQFQGSFNPAKDEADYHIQARYGGSGNWGDHILTHSGFTNPDQLLAWEWGNPTLSSPQKFLNKLRSFDNKGRDRTQVLWFSDQWYENYPRKNIDGTIVYNLAFVVTQDQMYESCGIYSCVVP